MKAFLFGLVEVGLLAQWTADHFLIALFPRVTLALKNHPTLGCRYQRA